MSEHEHNHEHGCDCGCEEELDVLTLTLDDDTELVCAILGVFELDEKEYIALLPENDDSVLIYRYSEEGEEVKLDLIEDDDEFERVSAMFEELYSEEEA